MRKTEAQNTYKKEHYKIKKCLQYETSKDWRCLFIISPNAEGCSIMIHCECTRA